MQRKNGLLGILTACVLASTAAALPDCAADAAKFCPKIKNKKDISLCLQSRLNQLTPVCKKQQEDRELLREAVKNHSGVAEAHSNWGVALVEEERYEEAVDEYLKALAIKKDFPACRVNLGLAYVKLGKLEEAIVQFREAVRLDPKNQDARRSLDLALAEQAKKPKAKAKAKP